ncbi:MAG: hypothetical protein FWF57_08255 [Defluviitaleaceae bacterium]|nr:hypothetical protein [Defluviitaleaceae bacterium]
MSEVYLHTVHKEVVYYYVKKLNIHMKNIRVLKLNEYEDIYIFSCYLDSQLINFLVFLLEEIIFIKNKIVSHENIKNTIIQNIFIPMRDKVKKELQEYLKVNDIINIEAYFNFRMEEHKVNMYKLIYSIVKNNITKS